MLFNSIEFLLFFPAVVLAYFILPRSFRLYWLLIVSYVFYMGWNPQYALLLLFSTGVTYLAGLMIGRARKRYRLKKEQGKKAFNLPRLYVAVSLLINLSLLFFFKYFDFAVDNVNALLTSIGREPYIPAIDVLLPVGISFYIFQALSYTIDVYRDDVRVEKNFFKYATFVSFFPQLVAGPIERSTNLLTQFDKPHEFDMNQAVKGLQLMVWGFFQKIVIADRAAILVNQVFNYSSYYKGFEVLIAMLLFAVQIYCDFAGYSNIAIGSAQVLGFKLMDNFRRPYFAQSVADFWRRWHISLSTWFRDYLYIPLGGNRKGKIRKYFNLMAVFLASGLWHGAAWNFVIWGGLNGVYQIIGSELKPYKRRLMDKFHMRVNTFSHKLLCAVFTFILIDISWVFFRAASFDQAIGILRNLFAEFNPWILTDGSLLNMGLAGIEWVVLLLAIGILIGVSAMQEYGMKLRDTLAEQELWFQWMLLIGGVFLVLIFGIYGPGFDAAAFIYFQF